MITKTITLISQNKHSVIAGIFSLWIATVTLFVLVDKTSIDQSDDQAPLPSTIIPETEKPREDGCIEMPDDILICDHAMNELSSNASPIATNIDIEDTNGFQHICSLSKHADFESANNLRNPKPEATNALNWMVERVGISPNFTILAADFHNASTAFASIRGKHRYIIYDVKKNFTGAHGKLSWHSLGVLGHELGHHLAGHTAIHNLPNHARELEADKFSGFILAKLGATKQQAAVWTDFLSPSGSITHPPSALRKLAAIDGWTLANKFDTRPADTCNTTWIGDVFEIEAKDCRIANRCVNGKQQIQLACDQDIDQWQWVN